MTNYSKHLKNNEELVKVIHRHSLSFFRPALGALILIILPFFLMFLLFRWQETGLVLFFILLIIGLIAIIRIAVLWSGNVFLITNQRLILFKQAGLFDKVVLEADFEDVLDVAFRIKGFWQTVGRYGSLRIQILDSDNNMIVSKISQPAQIQQLLLELKKKIGSGD
ncbi:MAG: hypothetical protein Q8P32_05050 [Candidatus Komeilibacteria bacterium]|nr:hypothetical protein [Candidatus Komeilibacteria bacterium]